MRRVVPLVLVFALGGVAGWVFGAKPLAPASERPAGGGSRAAWVVAPGKGVTSLVLRRANYADGRAVEYGAPVPRGDNNSLAVPPDWWVVSVDGHTYYLAPAE